MRIEGPRFYVVLGALSLCGTVASLSSNLILPHPALDNLGISRDLVKEFINLAFMIGVTCSGIGLLSLRSARNSDIGLIVVGSRMLPRRAMVAVCLPLYLIPWVAILWMSTL